MKESDTQGHSPDCIELVLGTVVCFLIWYAPCITTGPNGALVDFTSFPLGVSQDIAASGHSSAGAYTMFGLVCWGDASITGARELEPGDRPKLGRLSHVDFNSRCVCGVGCYWTTAHGLLP
jgi:hypothetical protein